MRLYLRGPIQKILIIISPAFGGRPRVLRELLLHQSMHQSPGIKCGDHKFEQTLRYRVLRNSSDIFHKVELVAYRPNRLESADLATILAEYAKILENL